MHLKSSSEPKTVSESKFVRGKMQDYFLTDQINKAILGIALLIGYLWKRRLVVEILSS